MAVYVVNLLERQTSAVQSGIDQFHYQPMLSSMCIFIVTVMFFSFWREVCPPNDALCEQDKIGYDSIQQLHLQIDDDNDGSLDRSESDEVSIITFTARHKKFRIDEPNLYVMPQTERVKNNTADKIIMTWHSCINPPLLPRSVPL